MIESTISNNNSSVSLQWFNGVFDE